ncbi:MAG: stage II sporulation protein P [Peptococcaceae bacterium]|nr:stage II sporulation protein P [Peptococcaceae bacterium]
MRFLIALCLGLLLAITLWSIRLHLEPGSVAVMAVPVPVPERNLGPLLVAAEKAETVGSLFFMLLFKGALPAYEAPGERPFWVEMVAYLSDRLLATEPHLILARGLPGLMEVPFKRASSPLTTTPDIPEPGEEDVPLIGGERAAPLIVLYHTHNSESFVPDSGEPHIYDNPDKTIVAVGRELARQLESRGALVIHSSEDHVRQAFDQSYTRSLETVTSILAKYGEVDYVFDIHRDALPRRLTTTKIDNQDVARIYFVVGGNEALGHLHWRRNYAFAMKLQQQVAEMFPGFSRGILLRDFGRFNQHVHPHALLIEIGGHENSLEEAIRATGYLAEAIMALDAKRVRPPR